MKKAAIIGGGFFGVCLAVYLVDAGMQVEIFEKESGLLKRASLRNQSRIHAGYHYPRSHVTAYRSLVNFPRFVQDFPSAVIDDFVSLYCIARRGSKVTAMQFHDMFKRMDAPIALASQAHRELFNADLIEQVFTVSEFAFDGTILASLLERSLAQRNIRVTLNTEVNSIIPAEGRYILTRIDGDKLEQADLVFNCTYSQINQLRRRSDLSDIPLKHEFTEMALIDLPPALKGIGVTVVDGPFFSVMPYPPKKLHSLSHVRYTPHYQWEDAKAPADIDLSNPSSNYPFMIRDASRYLPALRDSIYRESITEIKTVLSQNEKNDGRPILFQEDPVLPFVFTVLGGKIDNIYDLFDVLSSMRETLGLRDVSIDNLFRN